MRALFGLEPHRGEILLEGRAARIKAPTDAIDKGMFMLAEDRKTEGIFPVLSVLENALVARQPGKRSPLFLRPRVEGRRYEELKTFLGIRAHSPNQLVSTLSGGNQQKVLFGRALASKCRVLLLNEPTRGVDVGTKVEIHEIIRGLARDGAAVLVSSSDIPELAVLCDRCLSLCAGGQTTTLRGGQISEDNIVACVIGHMTEEALNGKR
jgi:ABC-type sugar transport system ATPase subunit